MRTRARSVADEQGFANEGCALSFVAGLLGLLGVSVMALLGRPVGWPMVMVLVVVGLPGFLRGSGISGLAWLSLLGLLACFTVDRSGGSVPQAAYFGLGILALTGVGGIVANGRRDRERNDET